MRKQPSGPVVSDGPYAEFKEVLASFAILDCESHDRAMELAVLGWSHEYQKAGNGAAARSLLERAVRLYPKGEDIARDFALLLSRSKDCRRALSTLSPFEPATRDARTLNVLALVQTCLENRPEVVRLLERSLALDPDQPEVARSLSVAREAAPPPK